MIVGVTLETKCDAVEGVCFMHIILRLVGRKKVPTQQCHNSTDAPKPLVIHSPLMILHFKEINANYSSEASIFVNPSKSSHLKPHLALTVIKINIVEPYQQRQLKSFRSAQQLYLQRNRNQINKLLLCVQNNALRQENNKAQASCGTADTPQGHHHDTDVTPEDTKFSCDLITT